jgi:hypothetical protein
LPLSGPLSVTGKSIIIYGKELSPDRQACGNIQIVHPTKAVVRNWFGRGSGKLQGSFTAQQSTSDQETSINIGLDGLARMASTMTVHIAPVETNLVIPCTEESLGELYDPLKTVGNTWNGAKNGNSTSSDAWPIGDLRSESQKKEKNPSNKVKPVFLVVNTGRWWV